MYLDNDWICQGFERLDMPFCGVHVVDQLPYCETHRCQVLGCLKVKDVSLNIPWCEDHMCGKPDCGKRRRDNSSVCSEHTG